MSSPLVSAWAETHDLPKKRHKRYKRKTHAFRFDPHGHPEHPEEFLLLGIMARAVSDWRRLVDTGERSFSASYTGAFGTIRRSELEEFFDSQYFNRICDVLGLEPGYVKGAL